MILNEQVVTIRLGSPAYPQAMLDGLGSDAPKPGLSHQTELRLQHLNRFEARFGIYSCAALGNLPWDG